MDPISIALALLNGWKIGSFIGELFSTKHAHDLQLAAESINSFENNRSPALLKKAIDCFERVDENDKKYAQCLAFDGIARCYYVLSALSLQEKRFDEALSYLSLGEHYPDKILAMETTFFTRKGSEIEELQSGVPETKELFRNFRQEILVKKAEEEERRRREEEERRRNNSSSPSSEINWKTVAVSAVIALVIAAVALLIVLFV